jgi:glycosyltransferase involved in cell wall biosynthesis
MFYNKVFLKKEIIYSIIIPIYNQEYCIIENLNSIIKNTLDSFEIIIILDFCFDNTEKLIIDFFNNFNIDNNNFTQIIIFKNEEKPFFETKCDNIGFKNSKGKYCLEIQADMKMTQLGYNLELVKPFLLYNNVIAVSGRCSHNLFSSDGIGKLGIDIEKTIDELKIIRNKFYVFESCNRGPLLLDKKKLEELNFLDETNFFLDNSDHDLMCRAYLEKKYVCGYVPIDFYAPIFLGSTRNTNNYNYSEKYIINKIEKEKLQKEKNSDISKYKNIFFDKVPIILDL